MKYDFFLNNGTYQKKGVPLLLLENGTLSKFQRKSQSESQVFVATKSEMELLPKKTEIFVSNTLDEGILSVFRSTEFGEAVNVALLTPAKLAEIIKTEIRGIPNQEMGIPFSSEVRNLDIVLNPC